MKLWIKEKIFNMRNYILAVAFVLFNLYLIYSNGFIEHKPTPLELLVLNGFVMLIIK